MPAVTEVCDQTVDPLPIGVDQLPIQLRSQSFVESACLTSTTAEGGSKPVSNDQGVCALVSTALQNQILNIELNISNVEE